MHTNNTITWAYNKNKRHKRYVNISVFYSAHKEFACYLLPLL